MRKTCKRGVDIIKYYEGFRPAAYKDTGGVWTIGFGHTGQDVVPGQVITEPIATMILQSDMEIAEKAVERLVKTQLNDNQFSALVCLVYNIGQGAFEKSTMLKCLNRGDFKAAADEFVRWDKDNGKEIKGLLARRRAERDLFNSVFFEIKGEYETR